VIRARENARRNRIDNIEFHVADLFQPVTGVSWLRQPVDKVLLDPPRAGAREILPAVAGLQPARIVYVSCNPATLARDAGILVHEYGYRFVRAGVMDMFPHTAHVESMAVFER
jgi:23S rRNA (uracil1939-C5)-methyltransferase